MSGNLLVNKTDLQALFISGTYCHRTGTRSPSCNTPQEPTIHAHLEAKYNKELPWLMATFKDTLPTLPPIHRPPIKVVLSER